jgi:hypothetical protein
MQSERKCNDRRPATPHLSWRYDGSYTPPVSATVSTFRHFVVCVVVLTSCLGLRA